MPENSFNSSTPSPLNIGKSLQFVETSDGQGGVFLTIYGVDNLGALWPIVKFSGEDVFPYPVIESVLFGSNATAKFGLFLDFNMGLMTLTDDSGYGLGFDGNGNVAPDKGIVAHSAQTALVDGVGKSVVVPHGLGACPSYVRLVLVCTTADHFPVGTEIDCFAFYDNNNECCPCSVMVDPVNLTLTYSGTNSADCAATLRGGFGGLNSMTNFSLKVYWF